MAVGLSSVVVVSSLVAPTAVEAEEVMSCAGDTAAKHNRRDWLHCFGRAIKNGFDAGSRATRKSQQANGLLFPFILLMKNKRCENEKEMLGMNSNGNRAQSRQGVRFFLSPLRETRTKKN